MSARRPVRPALWAGLMFLVLIGLGVWQIYRLHWKERILAAIDHAEAAPPVALPASPGRFQKVWVTGMLRPDAHVFYGSDVRDGAAGPVLGTQLIEPLMRAGAPPLLVDLGWIPDPSAIRVSGLVRLTGYVRPAEQPGLFSASDDPAGRRFYTLNPARMAAGLGLVPVAPYTLVVLGTAPPGAPVPATALPRLPNDHLSYAITWFGLAAVLVVIFSVWLRRARIEMKD